MKYTNDRPYADPAKAARSWWRSPTRPRRSKTVASTSRRSTHLFYSATVAPQPNMYGAGLAYAITKGWLWKHESGTYVKHPGRRRPVCVRLNAAYSCKSRSSRRSSSSSSRIIFAVSPSGYSRARSRHVASFLQLLFSRLGSGRNHTVVFVNAPHTGSIVPTPIVVAPIFRRTL
jgi:hypothetical protein